MSQTPTTSTRAATVRAAVAPTVKVVLQGSVVSVDVAEEALTGGACELVEMTRPQLADPDLVVKARRGERATARPCIRCNQQCQVRDARNPIISCTVEPSTGHETDDPCWYGPASQPLDLTVAGGGPAGMEAARVAALRGHRVTLVERRPSLGGLATVAGPGAAFVAWQQAELARLGVTVRLGQPFDGDSGGPVDAVIQCTGARPGLRPFEIDDDATVLDVTELRYREQRLPGEGVVVLFDPIGGPIAVALAEELGERAVLVTQDNIAGNELSRTGDLAPANVRLQQRGVRIERRALLRRAARDHVIVEDRYSGEQRRIDAVAVVDCGFREPSGTLAGGPVRAGDCVAPRTVYEAVLEGRRAVLDAERAAGERR